MKNIKSARSQQEKGQQQERGQEQEQKKHPGKGHTLKLIGKVAGHKGEEGQEEAYKR